MLDFTLDSNVNLEFYYRTFDLLAIEEISVTLFCVDGKIPKQDNHQGQITETTNNEVSSNEADFIKDLHGLILQSCEDGTYRRIGIFYVKKLTYQDQFMEMFYETTFTIV
jgi:hypothetical protein